MEYRVRLSNRRRIEKIMEKHGSPISKYIRIYALREMKGVIGDNDTFRFITSKFEELTVTARHYMDLLKEANRVYPRYVKHVYKIIGDAAQV